MKIRLRIVLLVILVVFMFLSSCSLKKRLQVPISPSVIVVEAVQDTSHRVDSTSTVYRINDSMIVAATYDTLEYWGGGKIRNSWGTVPAWDMNAEWISMEGGRVVLDVKEDSTTANFKYITRTLLDTITNTVYYKTEVIHNTPEKTIVTQKSTDMPLGLWLYLGIMAFLALYAYFKVRDKTAKNRK